MKKASDAFLTFLLDCLRCRFPFAARPLFGGHGLYLDGSIVGIIVNQALYLKAHPAAAAFFIEQGSEPFSYERNGKTVSMGYWKVPEEVLEEQAQLEDWVAKAVRAQKSKH